MYCYFNPNPFFLLQSEFCPWPCAALPFLGTNVTNVPLSLSLVAILSFTHNREHADPPTSVTLNSTLKLRGLVIFVLELARLLASETVPTLGCSVHRQWAASLFKGKMALLSIVFHSTFQMSWWVVIQNLLAWFLWVYLHQTSHFHLLRLSPYSFRTLETLSKRH